MCAHSAATLLLLEELGLQLCLFSLLLCLDVAFPRHRDHGALGLLLLPYPDRSQEGLEVCVKVLLSDPEIPVEKEEELLLHEVDFTVGEAKVLKARNRSVAGPVLVLW